MSILGPLVGGSTVVLINLINMHAKGEPIYFYYLPGFLASVAGLSYVVGIVPALAVAAHTSNVTRHKGTFTYYDSVVPVFQMLAIVVAITVLVALRSSGFSKVSEFLLGLPLILAIFSCVSAVSVRWLLGALGILQSSVGTPKS